MNNRAIFSPTEEKAYKMRAHKPILGKNPPIFQADNLFDLLSSVKCQFACQNGCLYKIVRFVVTLEKRLVFGKEGYPNETTPSHYQLISLNPLEAKCLTAGNAFFDENNMLCGINNKSGDFKPGFDSLTFALRVFEREHQIKAHFAIFVTDPLESFFYVYSYQAKDQISPPESESIKAQGEKGLTRKRSFSIFSDGLEVVVFEGGSAPVKSPDTMHLTQLGKRK